VPVSICVYAHLQDLGYVHLSATEIISVYTSACEKGKAGGLWTSKHICFILLSHSLFFCWSSSL